MLRQLSACVATFGLYGAVTVWLTWPLAPYAATHVPAIWNYPADALLLASSLAHQTRALRDDWGALPHPAIFYPEPYALFYGETAFGALPLFAPIFLVTGNPALGLNVVFLAGVAATAAAIHLVTTRLTGSWAAGLVAGWMFLTTHWVLWSWVPNAANYAVLFYLPWIMLLASDRLIDRRKALALAGLVTLQGLTSVYVAAASMLPLLVLGVLRLARPASRAAGRTLLVALTLASVPLLAAYSGHLVIRARNPDVAVQSIYAIVRGGHRRLPWDPFTPGAPTALSPTAFVLIVVGALMRLTCRPGFAAVPGRAWSTGILWTVVGVLGSLTPTVLWYGTRVDLPHAWVARQLGIYDLLRDPSRIGVAGLMGLVVLAGTGFAECASRLSTSRARAPVHVVLLLLAGLGFWRAYERGMVLPGVTTLLPVPPAYQVAEVPDDARSDRGAPDRG